MEKDIAIDGKDSGACQSNLVLLHNITLNNKGGPFVVHNIVGETFGCSQLTSYTFSITIIAISYIYFFCCFI